jgi:hypothetical protein
MWKQESAKEDIEEEQKGKEQRGMKYRSKDKKK